MPVVVGSVFVGGKEKGAGSNSGQSAVSPNLSLAERGLASTNPSMLATLMLVTGVEEW